MLHHALFLALQRLRAAPGVAATLAAAGAITLFLPAFTLLASARLGDALTARADATPVVLGPSDTPVALTLSALTFSRSVGVKLPHSVSTWAADHGAAIPLHLGHTARGAPLVGATLDYLVARELTVAEGRTPALIGEAIAGASAAEDLGLRVGDRLRSDLSDLTNLAGPYPVTLTVVGVLEPTGTPDDRVLLTDVKTSWAIDGHLHGHDDVSGEADPGLRLLGADDPSRLARSHLHGDADGLPVSCVLVFPPGPRAHDQLLGAIALRDDVAAARPALVVRELLGLLDVARDALLWSSALMALSTGLLGLLVIDLTRRLRSEELALMRRLGAGPGTLALVLAAELGLIAVGALALAAGATWAALSLVDRLL